MIKLTHSMKLMELQKSKGLVASVEIETFKDSDQIHQIRCVCVCIYIYIYIYRQ